MDIVLALASVLTLSAPVAQQPRVHVVEAPPLDTGAVANLLLNPDGSVRVRTDVSQASGGFLGRLPNGEGFGSALCSLGDVDGDGVRDLAVGAPLDGDGGPERGAVWILFLRSDASVRAQQKISAVSGGFTGPVGDGDNFGTSLAAPGDVDGDGVVDLLVGAPDGRAFYTLFLRPDGTVASARRVRDIAIPTSMVRFGWGLAVLGDLNGNGLRELAVCGQVVDRFWILELAPDGSVTPVRSLLSGVDFGRALLFGSLGSLGDLDGDGVPDLALGTMGDSLSGNRGMVWLLFLTSSGAVRRSAPLAYGGSRSSSAPIPVGLGDRNGDGFEDLAVGEPDFNPGGAWIVHLTWSPASPNGAVVSQQQLGATQGGLGALQSDVSFGSSLAPLGDLDGDGAGDVAIGMSRFDPAFVDPPDYTSLQAAIDAAASGDTLLVRPGRYPSGMRIAQKSLTLVADGEGIVSVDGSGSTGVRNQVSGLSAGQSVVLRGLEFSEKLGQPQLELLHNNGTVWVEECVATGVSAERCPGVRVSDSHEVVLVRSRLKGGSGARLSALSEVPAPALEVSGGSTVQAYGCTFKGGYGEQAEDFSSTNLYGREGAVAVVSSGAGDLLLFSDCTIDGGDGSCGYDFTFFGVCCCRNGGAGLDARIGSSFVLDSSLAGGAPGSSSGSSGAPYLGAPDFLAGRALALRSKSPVREGGTVVLDLDGPAFVPVWLGTAVHPGLVPAPQLLRGSSLVGLDPTITFVGVTDEQGHLRHTSAIPPLAPLIQSMSVFVQPYYAELGGPQPVAPPGKLRPYARRLVAGEGSALTLLDGAF